MKSQRPTAARIDRAAAGARQAPDARLEELFRGERRRLWGLAYRLTGNGADADDVVQEGFARLIERPPPASQPLKPWLVRVVVNLSLDALRKRRRRVYNGPWLPSPVEAPDAEWLDSFAAPEADTEARYGLLESASYAFLVALEALGPRERAVLLLRDVLGWSAAETGALFDTSEGNVRVIHSRARRALADYDRARCVPTPELRARHRETLERFLAALFAQDTGTVESLLAESVYTETDAGGEYTAVATRLEGRERVARLYLQAARMRAEGEPRIEIHELNGLPAALISLGRPVRRQAPRSVLRLELDGSGRICAIHSVLAPPKLGRAGFAL
jgi:RNA polymerase sigma-70 factor (ECF subfamily)